MISKRLQHYWDLLYVITRKEIQVKYKGSLLGYLWSVAHPLALAVIFYYAFKIVIRLSVDPYPYQLFLICGLFPWQWFSNSVTASPFIFISNASIIKKVNFPRNIIPLATILNDMIHFILTIPVIVVFMIFHGYSPSLSWIYGIPLLLLIQLLGTYGVVMIIASFNLFLRDLERITVLLITFAFYLTPIIYPASKVPGQYRTFLFLLNPLASLLVSWRMLFLEGKTDPFHLSLSFTSALLIAVVGHLVFRKLSWKFAEVI